MPRRAFMLPAMRFPAPVLALAVLALAACRPKPLTERIVGTYATRSSDGFTTMQMNADGSSETVGHYTGAAPFVSRGRYSIAGDTAYLTAAGDTSVSATASPAVLHGDSLIVLVNDPNIRRWVFLREK